MTTTPPEGQAGAVTPPAFGESMALLQLRQSLALDGSVDGRRDSKFEDSRKNSQSLLARVQHPMLSADAKARVRPPRLPGVEVAAQTEEVMCTNMWSQTVEADAKWEEMFTRNLRDLSERFVEATEAALRLAEAEKRALLSEESAARDKRIAEATVEISRAASDGFRRITAQVQEAQRALHETQQQIEALRQAAAADKQEITAARLEQAKREGELHRMASQLDQKQQALRDGENALSALKRQLDEGTAALQSERQALDRLTKERVDAFTAAEKRFADLAAREQRAAALASDMAVRQASLTQREAEVNEAAAKAEERAKRAEKERWAARQAQEAQRKREQELSEWARELRVRETECDALETGVLNSSYPGPNSRATTSASVGSLGRFPPSSRTGNVLNESLVTVQIQLLQSSYMSCRHRQFVKTPVKDLPRLPLHSFSQQLGSAVQTAALMSEVKEKARGVRRLNARARLLADSGDPVITASGSATPVFASEPQSEAKLAQSLRPELDVLLAKEKDLKDQCIFLSGLSVATPLENRHKYDCLEDLVLELSLWWEKWRAHVEERFQAVLEQRRGALDAALALLGRLTLPGDDHSGLRSPATADPATPETPDVRTLRASLDSPLTTSQKASRPRRNKLNNT